MSRTFSVNPGAVVAFRGKRATVVARVNAARVLVRVFGAATHEEASVSELQAIGSLETVSSREVRDLVTITDEDWAEAQRKFAIIEPLLNLEKRTMEVVRAHAGVSKVGYSTLYEWISRYEHHGMSGLLRRERADKYEKRLSNEVEDFVKTQIDDWLKPRRDGERSSLVKAITDIQTACYREGLEGPHALTIRQRILERGRALVTARVQGQEKADAMFDPVGPGFEPLKWPFRRYDVDHTPLDVMIVDRKYRRSIGRAYATALLDDVTRMIAGICITLEPPSASSVGLCLAHAIIPKETWCAKHGTLNTWDIYGLLQHLWVDNAKEFHGLMLERAAAEYGIKIFYRRKGEPDDGPKEERALKTFNRFLHDLPGSTFSNPQERAEYDSEGNAILTLEELERYATRWIVDVYHQTKHSSLGMSPSAMFSLCVLGDETRKGVGLPDRISDEKRLRLDFTPFVECAVTRQGVRADYLFYSHPVLRRFIKTGKKYVFRRDPRYLNIIYFWNEHEGVYYPIPLKRARSDISLREHKAAQKYLESKAKPINEGNLFRALDELNRAVEVARNKTAAVRAETSAKPTKSVRKTADVPPKRLRRNDERRAVNDERLRETGIKPDPPDVLEDRLDPPTEAAPARRPRRVLETVMPVLNAIQTEESS